RTAVVVGDRTKLVDGAAGRLEIARRKRDLDLCREQLRASQPVRRLLHQRTLDGAGGGIGVALGESHQRQSGLWLAAQVACPAKRFLSANQIASASADLADLVEPLSCH